MTDDLARRVLQAYDLNDIDRLHPLRPLDASPNRVFGLVARRPGHERPERLVLRIHRPGYREPAHTWSELLFLQGFPDLDDGPWVPRPVPNLDGDLVTDVRLEPALRGPDGPSPRRPDGPSLQCHADGPSLQCHADLTTWVDGRSLVPGDGLDLGATRALGAALARLHTYAAGFVPPPGFALPRWVGETMFSAERTPFRPTLGLDEILDPADRYFFDETSERLRAILADLESRPGEFGIIHVDFILGNCHLTGGPDNWRVGVFDFDDSGWGAFLYDLVCPLGNLAGYPGVIEDNPEFPIFRDALLDGYRSVRLISDADERLLPFLMAARNLDHCFFTARPDMSPTPREDAAWRVELARRCLALADTWR